MYKFKKLVRLLHFHLHPWNTVLQMYHLGITHKRLTDHYSIQLQLCLQQVAVRCTIAVRHYDAEACRGVIALSIFVCLRMQVLLPAKASFTLRRSRPQAFA